MVTTRSTRVGSDQGPHRFARGSGVPVLVVTRRMLTGPENDRQPVEAANIIIPADNTALDYTINLE